jgi:MSHA pilin protein MshB
MKKQSGFTLIELVIVVVILGFLAMTAIPKFIDLTDQAKQANIEGMAGGFATGISLARAQWEAEGRPNDGGTPAKNFVDYDGTTIYLTTEASGIRPGYALGTSSAIASIDDVECDVIWQSIFQQPAQIALHANIVESTDYVYDQTGAGVSTQCIYYLKETLAKNSDGTFQNPSANTAIGNNFTYSPADSAVAININNTP